MVSSSVASPPPSASPQMSKRSRRGGLLRSLRNRFQKSDIEVDSSCCLLAGNKPTARVRFLSSKRRLVGGTRTNNQAAVCTTWHTYERDESSRSAMFWSPEELEEMIEDSRSFGRQLGLQTSSPYAESLKFLHQQERGEQEKESNVNKQQLVICNPFAADVAAANEDEDCFLSKEADQESYNKRHQAAIQMAAQHEGRGLEKYACPLIKSYRAWVVRSVVTAQLTKQGRLTMASMYSSMSQRSVQFAVSLAQGDAAEAVAVWETPPSQYDAEKQALAQPSSLPRQQQQHSPMSVLSRCNSCRLEPLPRLPSSSSSERAMTASIRHEILSHCCLDELKEHRG